LTQLFRFSGTFSIRTALFVQGLLLCLAANALDLDAEKERIRQEVIEDVQDQTLVDALTQIRFKREVLMKLAAAEKSKSPNALTASVGREKSPSYRYVNNSLMVL
jgi:hypothetical protein